MTSPEGRHWQARRISGVAPMARSVRASASPSEGSGSECSRTRTRQVEQRALPPQTETWGMPRLRLISSSVAPAATLTVGPSI